MSISQKLPKNFHVVPSIGNKEGRWTYLRVYTDLRPVWYRIYRYDQPPSSWKLMRQNDEVYLETLYGESNSLESDDLSADDLAAIEYLPEGIYRSEFKTVIDGDEYAFKGPFVKVGPPES